MQKKEIVVKARTLRITGKFREPYCMELLDTSTLIVSLMVIKDCSYEQHTKNNLDKLIRMLLNAELDH
jgi:putative effector of murein hydrolase